MKYPVNGSESHTYNALMIGQVYCCPRAQWDSPPGLLGGEGPSLPGVHA